MKNNINLLLLVVFRASKAHYELYFFLSHDPIKLKKTEDETRLAQLLTLTEKEYLNKMVASSENDGRPGFNRLWDKT